MNVLVTGAAGFIGFHTCKNFLEKGYRVVGIDNINNYYDVKLKLARLAILEDFPSDQFNFHKVDIASSEAVNQVFKDYKFDFVVHLAAQAGVRYSIDAPHKYISSNCQGFLNVIEACRHNQPKHFLYASSSSVYGENSQSPFRPEDKVDHPISLYAATKRANELIAHSYSHLYDLACTGLRFFTVYGPWGRPDMAPMIFTKAIFNNEPLNIFNNGEMERDFTYIDDITEAITLLTPKIPTSGKSKSEPNKSTSPFRIFNIGNSEPVNLLEFIKTIEKHTGKTTNKVFMPMQPGDVPKTYAYVDDLYELIGFKPKTNLDTGIKEFVKWYKSYYKA